MPGRIYYLLKRKRMLSSCSQGIGAWLLVDRPLSRVNQVDAVLCISDLLPVLIYVWYHLFFRLWLGFRSLSCTLQALLHPCHALIPDPSLQRAFVLRAITIWIQ